MTSFTAWAGDAREVLRQGVLNVHAPNGPGPSAARTHGTGPLRQGVHSAALRIGGAGRVGRQAAGLCGLSPVLSWPSRPSGFNPSRLRAHGAACCACLRGKALRAIPAARYLAPLDAADPAAPDRPGLCPAMHPGHGGYAGTCSGKLRECVPSSTLAARCLRVAKDGSRTCRPALRGSFHAAHPAWQPVLDGASSSCRWEMALEVSGGVPVNPSCGNAESAMSPCGVGRPKASCLLVNPGDGRASMAATFQPQYFPLR